MMFDSPMHSMEDGIKYVTLSDQNINQHYKDNKKNPSDENNQNDQNKFNSAQNEQKGGEEQKGSSISSRSAPQCWKCGGTGRLVLKKSSADKAHSTSISEDGMVTYYKECSICKNEVIFPLLDSNIGKVSQFTNYTPSGSTIENDCRNPLFHPKKGESLCSLSGHYMIYQHTRGHRFTTDDVCTAFFAYNEMKMILSSKRRKNVHGNNDRNKNKRNDDAIGNENEDENGISESSHLDLGCGLGSVLLMMKWKFGKGMKIVVQQFVFTSSFLLICGPDQGWATSVYHRPWTTDSRLSIL